MQVKHTGDARGMGLYATKNICEDNNIIEYMGELITMAEKKKRHNSLKLLSAFQAKYTDELAIDADLYGNESDMPIILVHQTVTWNPGGWMVR